MNRLVEEHVGRRVLGDLWDKYFDSNKYAKVEDVLEVLIKNGKRYMYTRSIKTLLGVTSTTIRNWIRNGKVHAVKSGNLWMVDISSLLNYVKSRFS